MNGIRVSREHGVNPTIPLCFFCGEPKNEVALLGKLPDDAEAPRNCVLDMVPCDTCAERRKTHVHLVVVKDGQDDVVEDQRRRWLEYMSRLPLRKQSPFMPQLARTGCTYWVDRDKIPAFTKPSSLADSILEAGWVFMPEEVAKELGLDKLRKEMEKAHPDAEEILCHDVKWATRDAGGESDA